MMYFVLTTKNDVSYYVRNDVVDHKVNYITRARAQILY